MVKINKHAPRADRWHIDLHAEALNDEMSTKIKETLRKQGLSYNQAIGVLESTVNDLKAEAMTQKLNNLDADDSAGLID